ncbi:hypothetical protein D3C71_1875360 [compost metagenome]
MHFSAITRLISTRLDHQFRHHFWLGSDSGHMITFALDEAENAQMTGLSRVKPIWALWDSRVFRQIKITFRDLETVKFLEIQLFE